MTNKLITEDIIKLKHTIWFNQLNKGMSDQGHVLRSLQEMFNKEADIAIELVKKER